MIRLLYLWASLFLSFNAVAFRPTFSFWYRAVSPFFATIDSTGLGNSPSNSLTMRSVVIGGPGILSYKAVVISAGTCESAGVAALLLAASETNVAFPFAFTPPGETVDSYFTVCAIGKTFVGAWQSELKPTPSSVLRVNTTLPVMQSFSMNNGVTEIDQNSVPASLSATHTNLNITHFCLKSVGGSASPIAPNISDSCWKALDGYSPPVSPSKNIAFSGYNFNIGFTGDTFNIYAWVRSESGAISALGNGGAGASGVDRFTLTYAPGLPPTIINVLSTNSDSPSDPEQPSDLYIPGGQTVFIKWKATDDKALANNSISISYTTDEKTFTSVVSGIANTAGSGCSIDSRYTGCFKWINGSPTSGYFKIRVGVTDSNGLISYGAASPNNTTPFSIIAGNTDLGLGGSARAAILKTQNSFAAFNSGQGRFVVRNDSSVYVLDQRGLLTISPSDGLLKVYIPLSSSIVDGPVGSATLKNPVKMALDASQNLIIYDYNRIRKINFATQSISSIVGGGASTAHGADALSFSINPITGSQEYALFTVLPNGNIWFQTADDYMKTQANGSKIRIYNAADQKVYILTPTGTGSLEDAAFDPANYSIYNYGIAFDPVTSAVTKIRSRSIIPTPGGFIPRSVSYNPSNGGAQAPHVPYANYWTDDCTFTSAAGEMYNVDHFQQNGVHKYSPTTNTWTRILGTGVKGQCADGTAALSCRVDVNDVFVNATGTVYFMDRNQIRVIDSGGKVQTLYGQSLAYGDGLLATSARMSRAFFIDQANDGRIVLIDPNERHIREFNIGGTINHVAGDGSEGTPNTASVASTQAINANYWGGQYPFVLDPTTGDIFFTRSGYELSRLNRSTGKWVDIAGGGGTSYTTADGLLGSQINFLGYPMGPQGYSGTHLLRSFHQWNGTTYVDSMLKTFSVSDGAQTHFAGITGENIASLSTCAAGSSLATCKVPSNFNSMSKAQYDSANNRWLLNEIGGSRIYTAVTGGSIGTLVTLPRGIQSFYYTLKSSIPHVYYCSGGRIYKYNLNSSTETALFWPTSTIQCDGYALAWDSAKNAIIFPILQNGIGGIAMIQDP